VRNSRNSRDESDDTLALWQRPLIWAGNCLLMRPRDSLLSIGAATAVGAIIINGLYLQPGPHPAPIFAFKPAPVTADAPTGAVVAVPRPRPDEASPPAAEPRVQPAPAASARPQTAARRDPIAELLSSPPPARVAASSPAAAPVPPAPIPAASASSQLRAIQQRLGEFGYGPVKANGIDGPETRTAIERFERSHGLPVTGKVSERLKTELVNMTGPL